MQINKYIGCVVCVLLAIRGTDAFAQSFVSSSSTWGYSSYVNDYYYGDRSAFEMDDNMFTHDNTVVQGMGSTSWDSYSPGAINTAASSIESGSTIAGYFAETISRRLGRGRDDHQWETDDQAPIGDGWDVIVFLLLLAACYGGYIYVRSLRCKKSDRCAVRS